MEVTWLALSCKWVGVWAGRELDFPFYITFHWCLCRGKKTHLFWNLEDLKTPDHCAFLRMSAKLVNIWVLMWELVLVLYVLASFTPHSHEQGNTPHSSRFTGDELGFGGSPAPGSARKQGWRSNRGCLILKCVLAPDPCAWLVSESRSPNTAVLPPCCKGLWLCWALVFTQVEFSHPGLFLCQKHSSSLVKGHS